jgi:hypothetical protein
MPSPLKCAWYGKRNHQMISLVSATWVRTVERTKCEWSRYLRSSFYIPHPLNSLSNPLPSLSLQCSFVILKWHIPSNTRQFRNGICLNFPVIQVHRFLISFIQMIHWEPETLNNFHFATASKQQSWNPDQTPNPRVFTYSSVVLFKRNFI